MKGQDNQLNSRMSPAMDAGNIGYTQVLLGLGFNFINKNRFLKNQRFAIEINNEIVPKSQHDSFLITNQDKIEVVEAVGGG